MGRLRKLRRAGRMTRQRVEPLRERPSFWARKISEVLLEFAEPLFDTISTDKEFEAAVCLAIVCWNSFFLTRQQQQIQIKDIIDKLGGTDALARLEIEKLVRVLMDRKQPLFAGDKRIVVNYEIVEEPEGPRLLVMSTFAKEHTEDAQKSYSDTDIF